MKAPDVGNQTVACFGVKFVRLIDRPATQLDFKASFYTPCQIWGARIVVYV